MKTIEKITKSINLPNVAFILCLATMFSSCKKDAQTFATTATINVINAAVDVPAIKVNIGTGFFIYNTAPQVNYGGSGIYYAQGTTVPIKVVASSDTTTFLVNSSYNFHQGVYSIYVAGQAPKIDTLIRQETNYPYIHNDISAIDSSFNVRFVNLSPNSSPVNINIKNAATTEASNLSYKGISAFKKYPADYKHTTYALEIRDAASNSLLATLTLTSASYRFKNIAVLIKGLEGTTTGTDAFGASAITQF
jgi:hypothetical protein